MSVTVHVRWPGEKEHVQLIPPFLFQKNLNCMHDSSSSWSFMKMKFMRKVSQHFMVEVVYRQKTSRRYHTCQSWWCMNWWSGKHHVCWFSWPCWSSGILNYLMILILNLNLMPFLFRYHGQKKIDSNITEMVGIPFFMFGCLRKNPRIVTLLKSSLVVARSHELCVKWLGLTHKHKHKYI